MTLIDEDRSEVEARTNLRLRVAGIVAILAAAVGSAAASPAGSAPATDEECSMAVAARVAFTDGCTEEPVRSSAR